MLKEPLTISVVVVASERVNSSSMPGKIESTAFLSQLEDMDKYLLEYRSLKLMPQASNTFGAGVNHLRFAQGNDFDSGDNVLKGMSNCRKVQLGNYGNGTSNGNGAYNANGNGGNVNANGRKKFMGKQQGFRMQSPTLKMPPQSNNKFAGSPLVNTHFKQAYPQVYYSPSNSNSNISLGHSWQTQSPGEKTQLSSSNSSPSYVPPRVDSAMSGTSSSMANYDATGFDYVVPTPTEYNNQFSSVSGPFTSYLSSGVVPTACSAGTTTAATPVAPVANFPSSTSGDMIGNLTGTSFAPSTGTAASVSSSLAFDQSLAHQTLPSTISASMRVPGLPGSSSAVDLSSSNLGGDRMLMNDLSLGWGSNHVSSAGTENYGIWNNDMSVWS